jgi:hypothetical protein
MRSRALAAGLLVAAVITGSAGPAAAHGPSGALRLEVLSSPRPDLVTGGDALVRVTLPAHTRPDRVRVRVGGRDVTAAFRARSGDTLLGVVTGLPVGHSVLAASAGGRRDVLQVRNHPITGPVFAGTQQQPFFCETQAFGLAPATPPSCAAPTVVGYVYRSTAGRFVPLADPAARPADLAQATVDGRSVPYIVRVERGTIDRAVYELAALYDGQEPSPVRAAGAWNRRLVYTFGGGCNVGYHQGAATGGVLDDLFLSRGYAVASSSLNVLDNNCSSIISAEVAMMVKEHAIETYGPVAHTIGWGGSGGAIQQHQIADSYPGILDGIIPQVSFPDQGTVGGPVADCRLLRNYFTTTTLAYTEAQRTAVSGFRTWGSCVNWDLSFASRGHAMQACPTAIPPAFLYHPETNPGGIKCTTAEQLVNVLGRDRRTGFARSYLDNVGVQYGLAALTAGVISAEQFVDINAKAGGFDVIGDFAPERAEADPVALVRVYRSGITLAGSGGLASTPIIDLRAYTDAVNDIHTRFWSFAVRERLAAANGSAANQIILAYGLTPMPADPAAYALDSMEAWLTAIAADRGRGDARARMLRNRPTGLSDGCWTATGELVRERATWQGTGTCNSLYPSAADTRIAAGAPLRDDVLKCQLKPLRFSDYPVTFSAEQRNRLRAAFPTGVCDYSRRGVGQVPFSGVWQTY